MRASHWLRAERTSQYFAPQSSRRLYDLYRDVVDDGDYDCDDWLHYAVVNDLSKDELCRTLV